jgi:hypothetical protein
LMLRFAQEFGLTPAARMRVEVNRQQRGCGRHRSGAKKPNPFAG